MFNLNPLAFLTAKSKTVYIPESREARFLQQMTISALDMPDIKPDDKKQMNSLFGQLFRLIDNYPAAQVFTAKLLNKVKDEWKPIP